MQRLLVIVPLLLFLSCEQKKQKPYPSSQPKELPPSHITFQVDFPQEELNKGINQVLGRQLLDQGFQTNKKGDSLYLTIVRTGDLILDVEGLSALATLPITVEASIKKKVLGIQFSNRDSPIKVESVVSANIDFALNNDWQIQLACRDIEFKWISVPAFNILGLNVNISELVEKNIKANQTLISTTICQAINDSFDFRSLMIKVYDQHQKPIRISREPLNLWMLSRPSALNGQLIAKEDSLCVQLELSTELRLSDSNDETFSKSDLPNNDRTMDQQNGLHGFVETVLKFNEIEQLLAEQFVGENFTFEGYDARIDDLKISGESGLMKVVLKTSGDFNGQFRISGIPKLTKDKKMKLDELDVEVIPGDNANEVMNWAIKEFAPGYIKKMINYDLNPMIEKLDELALNGVEASPIGEKMNLMLEIEDITSYHLYIAESYMIWTLQVDGNLKFLLKSGVFGESTAGLHN